MSRVQTIMWTQAGVNSDRTRLLQAAGELEALRRLAATQLDRSPPWAWLEASNLALTAELVARAKLAREESRSAHNRMDFPQADARWEQHVCLSRGVHDEVIVATRPVVL
jgi:aspartate oxidase